MMQPLPFAWNGAAFEPVGRHARAACEATFGAGQIVRLVEHQEHSEVSMRHQFAWLKAAWESLPPDLIADYPSPDHLRKAALIRTGWCTVQDYPCGSRAEAQRWVAFLKREVDPYTIVEPSESVVRVYRARSQARGAMSPKDFRAAKDAVLMWVSNLLGVEPDALERRERAA